MKILVTGGTGFIGSHVVEALAAQGHAVVCLVRSPARPGWLAGLDVELVEGDCVRPETLQGALRGVQGVVHAAGATFAPSRSEFFRVNAEGSRNLVEACLEAGHVERFVLVSSQAAAGPGAPGHPVREADPVRPISTYGESKLAAEHCCLDAADRLRVCILRPSAVYGPRDRAFLTVFRLARRGILLELGGGKRVVSLCYVGDLARAIVRAIDSHLRSGSVYFVADSEPYAWGSVEQRLCAHWGVTGRRFIVPGIVLKTAGVIGQAYGALTGKSTPINRARAAELLEKHWVCDSTAAQRDLEFPPGINLENGLQKAVRWYEQNKWL